MDKKLYDKRKKPDCKKEQQRKEIFSTYSELCPQKPQDNRLSGLETGNKKTGKSGRIYDKILVWNIPPRITCPGVSDWCSTHCYNADARKDVYTIDRWCENLWDFHFRLPELKDKIENQINETTGRCAVRLHSSGDFFSEEYIDFWKEIILEFPKVSFWGYTRTWNVPCLKDNVNELMNLNNMQLFASYDTTMATSVPAIPKSLVFDTRENLFEYTTRSFRLSRSMTSSMMYAWNILNVLLKNKGFDTIARKNMDRKQTGRYDAYNLTYGNRPELFGAGSPTYSGGTTGSIGSGGSGGTGGSSGGGFRYDIPEEALSDEKFARMIAEAEKYLGMPYVWGGSSPSTSFDCSGFVCWVINNCGNGWNVGRTTANGLRGKCSYVSPANAQPGDLIFFEKTYNTVGASHVGIYVGNGMMIHCGDPISYTSINSTYWQNHFLGFGRIK